jgi:hypothetical protein
MQGSIDEVRLYSRALSEDDVALLYSFESPNQPFISIEVKTVRVKMGELKIGKKYQLESSTDISRLLWTPVGSPFTAASLNVIQDFNVSDTGRYFRLFEIQ